MRIAILILLLIAFGCVSKSQNGSQKLIINDKLSHSFFDREEYVQKGYVRTYVDSVLIDSSYEEEISAPNAYIRDSKKAIIPFDTCSSIFIGDTLKIVIKTTGIHPKNILVIKVIDDEFFPCFYSEGQDDLCHTRNKRLEFKTKPTKRGDTIMAFLDIEFEDTLSEKLINFKGPFFCPIQ